MTITDDERKAREWAEQVLHGTGLYTVGDNQRARTILALLDAAEAAEKARDAATCNDYLQVHRRVTDAIWESQTRCDDPEEHASAALAALKAAGVKFNLTTPDVDAVRDAALEEAAKAAIEAVADCTELGAIRARRVGAYVAAFIRNLKTRTA